MTRVAAGLMLLALTGVPVDAADRSPMTLNRGTPLRLFLDDGQPRRVEGRLQDADVSTVILDTGGGRSERFSRDALRAVHYRTGGRDREKGAKIGAAITGLAGVVGCIVALSNEPSTKDGRCDQCATLVGICGVVGALPGAAIGFAIGTTGGEWHGAPAAFTVANAAVPRRATVAVRIRFGR